MELIDPAGIPPSSLPPSKAPKTQLSSITEFRIRYLVEGLITHGVITLSSLPRLVKSLASCDLDLQERILTALFNEERIPNIAELVDIRSKQVYSCMVTPTRILLFPAEQETSNDVLRRHRLHVDRFLRVQFMDEDNRVQVGQHKERADQRSTRLSKPETTPIPRSGPSPVSGEL